MPGEGFVNIGGEWETRRALELEQEGFGHFEKRVAT